MISVWPGSLSLSWASSNRHEDKARENGLLHEDVQSCFHEQGPHASWTMNSLLMDEP